MKEIKMITLNLFENDTELFENKYNDRTYFEKYIILMADTGHLEVIRDEIDAYLEKQKLFSDSNEKSVEEISVVLKFNNFFNKIDKLKKINDVCNIYDLFYYSMGNDDFGITVFNLFIGYYNDFHIETASHSDHMIINYFVNKSVICQFLNVDQTISLLKYFAFSRRRNNRRSTYCIIKLTEYSINMDFECFFKFSDTYNHIQNALQRIYLADIIKPSTKRLITDIIQTKIKLNNNFSIPVQKKIAICISGVYRGHEEALKSIVENLVEPLNADIYMHSWDQTALWPGIGGTPSFIRLFGAEGELNAPEEYRGVGQIRRVRHKFPQLYEIIRQPVYGKTDRERLVHLLKTENIFIENDEKFHQLISVNPAGFEGRGGLNQAKMFYGINESFKMALNSGRHYDYIIRTRPDVFIRQPLNIELINQLEPSVFYGLVERVVGITDLEFTLSSSMAYSFVEMCENMYKIGRLNPFAHLPKYDSHLLILCWLIDNHYHNERDLIDRVLLDSGNFNKFPGLKQAIELDKENLIEAELEYFGNMIKYFEERSQRESLT